MIKNVELLYSTCSLLKNKFNYKILIKNNESEIKEPTFFVNVTPLISDSYFRYNKKLTNIVITYVNRVILQEELLNIQDSLNDLFDMYLEVENLKIIFDNKKFNITKDFMTLTLTLNYLDTKTNTPDGDKYTQLMGELIDKEG